jgi:hypothetical protein
MLSQKITSAKERLVELRIWVDDERAAVITGVLAELDDANDLAKDLERHLVPDTIPPAVPAVQEAVHG